MAEPPPVAVKTILELSQADIDGSTSLYAVRGCSRSDVEYCGWEKKPIRIYGKDYHIDITDDYYYKLGERNLEKIVGWLTGGMDRGCIYYVLNAPDIAEATHHIELYANTKGSTDIGLGQTRPAFCKETDFKQVSAKFRQAPRGVMPRNITSSDSAAAELLRRDELGLSSKKPPRPRSRSPKTKTGGRKNRRRSAASKNKKSRKNYRRS